MLGFTKFIHYAQKKFKIWLDNEYRKIAEAMEFDEVPKVYIPETVISDPNARITALNGLKDRGIISNETAYKETKRILNLKNDYEDELAIIMREKKMMEEGKLPQPTSPYQTSPKEVGRPKEK